MDKNMLYLGGIILLIIIIVLVVYFTRNTNEHYSCRCGNADCTSNKQYCTAECLGNMLNGSCKTINKMDNIMNLDVTTCVSDGANNNDNLTCSIPQSIASNSKK